MSSSQTLNAVATKSGFTNASVQSAAYVINGSAATPVFSPVAGTYGTAQTVTISTTTSGATICYTTDGSTPTATTPGTCSHGTAYSATVTVSSSQTLNALATKSGYTNSSVQSAAYVINGSAATPIFSPAAGTYGASQTVTISSTTSGATICYTTDGTTPTATTAGSCSHGTVYSTTVTVSSSQTLNALATKSGYTNSSVQSAAYVISGSAATPTFSPAAGTYGAPQTVTISTTTSGATIYYTTDGSSPTTGSPAYSSPISVATSETVQAIAVASGYSNSAVGSSTYTIGSGSPAYVQQCNSYQGYGTSAACTLNTVGAGHTLVIGVFGPTASGTIMSSAGTPQSVTSDGANGAAYILPNSSSGNITITASFSGNNKIWLSVIEYSNVAASPLDGSNYGKCSGYCTAVASGNITTSMASDMLWSFCSAPGGATVSTGTLPITWTGRTSPTGSGEILLTEDGLAGAAGTYYGQCTGAGNNSIVSLALKPSVVTQAATPTFSPAAGTYSSAQTVTISDATPAATIYYTTNGTNPTTGSTPYTAPIAVSTSETLKAIANASGYSTSNIGSSSYTIGSGSPVFVQQCNNSQGYGETTACTLSAVGAGHTLVIGVYGPNISGSVTSSVGTPQSVVSDGSNMSAYILPNASAGTITITASFSASTKIWLSVIEYSNVATSPLDGSGYGVCSGYCTSLSSSNFTTTLASDMLWSFCSAPGGATVATGTAPVTWTGRTSPNGSGEALLVEDGSAGSAGIYYGQCTGAGNSSIVSLGLHR